MGAHDGGARALFAGRHRELGMRPAEFVRKLNKGMWANPCFPPERRAKCGAACKREVAADYCAARAHAKEAECAAAGTAAAGAEARSTN